MNLLQCFVSYNNGVFSAMSDTPGISGSNFSRTDTGEWILDLTGVVPSKVTGAWGNVVQDNSLSKDFDSDLHLVETGGPSVAIYSRKSGTPADDLQLKLLISYV